MKVPFFDLSRYHADLLSDAEALFRRCFAAGRGILGPEVSAFESELAVRVGVAHALGTSSGTDALVLALLSLGVGPGDSVLTTPLTFFASAEAIARVGARPLFCDVDLATYNWSAASLQGAPRDVRAAVAVHLFGRAVPMLTLPECLPGASIVEDAAQALSGVYAGRALGTWGAVGCFSFFPSKPLGALGDAGALVTDRAELAARCRQLRVHDVQEKYVHGSALGGNYRLDEVQAGILRLKLPAVETRRQRRRALAQAYDDGLADVAELVLPPLDDAGHAWSVYSVRVLERRAALVEFLKTAGVETCIYYPLPVHLQPAFRSLGYARGDFPVAERLSDELLALPIFPELTPGEQSWVIEQIRAFFGRTLRVDQRSTASASSQEF